MADGGLQVSELAVRAGAFTLGPVSIEVPPGRVLVVLGPSGAGKTVLLETLAGFRPPAAGRIALAGRDITGLAPEERRIGLVFQHYALFPNLSVRENVRFGLRARGVRDPAAADTMLGRLGIAPLARRRPGTLSGGEQQRVALARALVVEPRLMLLDEPLSALDAPTREELRDELRRLLLAAGVPAICVTHDQAEALSLGDDVAVLMDGKLRQCGPIEAVFERPADAAVARFLGMEALGEAVVTGDGAVLVNGRRVAVEGCGCEDGPLVAVYRAEQVRLAPGPPAPCTDEENLFNATVAAVTPLGPVTRYRLTGELPLVALAFRNDPAVRSLRPGDRVVASLPRTALRLVAAG